MSIYKQYVVTLFIDIFAVSFGRLSLNRRRLSNATWPVRIGHNVKKEEKKVPIELLLFLFMAKMMVITGSEVHKFCTKLGPVPALLCRCCCWIELVHMYRDDRM